jgi:transposase
VAFDPRDALIEELLRRVDELMTRVSALEKRNVELELRNTELEKRNAWLEKRNAELEARLAQNSRNSSKPPSSDGPDAPRGKRGTTGRKRGGQPGHDGNRRELLPPERVDQIEDHWPSVCEECTEPLPSVLRTEVGEAVRHQVVELPRVQAHVVEHRLHQQHCDGCGHTSEAKLPAAVASGAFGPRLRGLTALCAGRFRLSKRITQELLSDVLGVELSLGSVSNIEQKVSAALAAPVEEVRQFVRQQGVVHADETGWREAKSRAWLWTATTAKATVFQISKSRGASVAKEMLGENFPGTLVVDRWAAYNWVETRQVCWAHLRRDFQGFVDRGGRGKPLGEKLLEQTKLMFELWHRLRDKTLLRATFQTRMKPIEKRILRLLEHARTRAERRTAGMAREILGVREYLWCFVDTVGVDPTNNAAERAIRPAVLWRKGSFGTDSPNGSRFVERVLTAVTTLKQQGRNVLDYLAAATEDYAAGRGVQSLLSTAA